MKKFKIKYVTRDRLFHDKYKYSITFYVRQSTVLRGYNSPKFNKDLILKRIYERNSTSLSSARMFISKSWVIKHLSDSEENVKQVEELYTLLREYKDEKIVFSMDWVTVFTNDLEIAKEIDKVSTEPLRIRQANVKLPRGYISCKKSQHKYRIYLRHTRISPEEHIAMQQFVKTYKNHIFQSKSFKEWVDDQYSTWRPSEYFFYFETDDKKLGDVLDLTVPKLKSRVCRILSDKYNTIEETE